LLKGCSELLNFKEEKTWGIKDLIRIGKIIGLLHFFILSFVINNIYLCAESLWSEREVYVQDNTLRLLFELDFLGDLACSSKNKVRRNPLRKKRTRDDLNDLTDNESECEAVMKEDMKRLFESHNQSDVIIECGAQQFPVHKIIICGKVFMWLHS